MNYLLIRTDNHESEIYIYEDSTEKLAYKWEAHRDLAKNLLSIITDKLNSLDLDFEDLSGVGVYKGPGSFTGLRIGISTANSIAYSVGVPIASESGDEWIKNILLRLNNADDEKTAMPFYGAEANITKPKK